MPSKLIFFIVFFICSHLVMAQKFSVDEEINRIDSLILYNWLDIAQKKADSLSNYLISTATNKSKEKQALEVKFRKAVILDRQEGSVTDHLQILLQINNKAENEKLHSLAYRTCLMIALAYEKADNFELTDKYLNRAFTIYKVNNLEELYSTYCVRRSSYYHFVNKADSSKYFANTAKRYAKRYQNETDLTDSYILLRRILFLEMNYRESLKYSFLLLKSSFQTKDSSLASIQYNAISKTYLKLKDYSRALVYSDSAYMHYKKLPLIYKYYTPKARYEIYEALGNSDSAYHYFKQYHHDLQSLTEQEEKLKTKKLEEQFQHEKNEAIIKNKDQQIIFIVITLGLIALASVLLFRKNQQINNQNKIISRQLEELKKVLEQKQVLLLELQHRVKNNLQHVISILEIQKESTDFNNIDELIRGNQNRIQSMALLHKKLDVSESVNEVDLRRYITELSELVRDSYHDYQKNINLSIKCTVDTTSIGKALPIGLIITELISNSIKHAFKKEKSGGIHIEITKTETFNQIFYSDNGSGFDFNKKRKTGLGIEIIEGLINQLNGKVVTRNNKGFEMIINYV